MTPEKFNSIVLIMMLIGMFIIMLNKDKKYSIIEVGMLAITLILQMVYTYIAFSVIEVLFSVGWGWILYRSWRRNYAT